MSKVETNIDQVCFVGFSKGSAWKQLRLLLQTGGKKRKLFHHPQGSSLSIYPIGTTYLSSVATQNAQELEYQIRKQLSAWKTPAADSFQDETCPMIARIKNRGSDKLKVLALYLALLPSDSLNLTHLCGWNSEAVKLKNPSNLDKLKNENFWPCLSRATQDFVEEFSSILLGMKKINVSIDVCSDGILEVSQFKIAASPSSDLINFLESHLSARYNQSSQGESLGLQIDSNKNITVWQICDRMTLNNNGSCASLVMKDLQKSSQNQKSTPSTRRAS